MPYSDNPSLIDNWDDSEGYYKAIPGELIKDRYLVYSTLGKGVFSTVIRAKDNLNNNNEVAIKIVRNNDVMYRAGQREIFILNKLKEADPNDKRHVIRMLSHFEYRNHLCIVFESLSMNLREVVKKFGKDVGLNLKAVRTYAHQMFQALFIFKKCRIIHADLKPDNILVNDNKTVLKICDLGSASDSSESEITPFLVSRYYRPPEIILGLPYDESVDVWSIGCTLYELYTGKILFPGRDNNQMLRYIMELKGRIQPKMIRRGQFMNEHFDEDLRFIQQDVDKFTNKILAKQVVITKPTMDLRTRLSGSRIDDEDKLLFGHFIDFLENCLSVNPEKRICPKDALLHPFLG